METTTFNKKELVNAKNAKDLTEAVRKSFIEIEKFIKHNDYSLKSETGDFTNQACDMLGLISMASLNKRKELRNHLWVVSKHMTIRSVNKYFKFLHQLLRKEISFRVEWPKKHNQIQSKRFVYKQALAAAKKAYSEYKEEKGDYYKSRLANFQRID